MESFFPGKIILNPTRENLLVYIEKYESDLVQDASNIFTYSGKCTGRCPKDKYIVCDDAQASLLWWRDEQKRLDKDLYQNIKQESQKLYSNSESIYCIEGFLGWDTSRSLKIKAYTYSPSRALFLQKMLVPYTITGVDEILKEYILYDFGKYELKHQDYDFNSARCIVLNSIDNEMLVCGTEYLGELKKILFTLANYIYPQNGDLSMHCAANQGINGDVSLFFGLSGTGKTTLSIVQDRQLIGDDEIVWTQDGVFNIEGGCYAKCIGLDTHPESLLDQAVRTNTLFENVPYKNGEYNLSDDSLTENTRATFSINQVGNSLLPCIATHPKNIFFLTFDTLGIFPFISEILPQDVSYWFLNGYTSKVAGTEKGILDKQVTFSACFGEPFFPFPPRVYGDLLNEFILTYNVRVWLVNTGYSKDRRINLKETYQCIADIHGGYVDFAYKDAVFGLKFKDVPDYDEDKARHLKRLLDKNYKKYG